MMTCQQLTTVCIFMTTYQIAPAQWPFNGLVIPGQPYLLNYGLLPQPPKGYHFETLGHILNTYPKNSYKIKYGLLNNNKHGMSSSPKRGSGSNNNKSKKKKKSKEQSPEDIPGSEPPENPTGNPPANPPANSPTAAPPAGTPPANPEGTA